MLFVFVAQADAAASCAAFSGRGIAAAALRLTVHRSWPAVASRTYLVRCFLVLASFFVLPRCRTSPHPSSISEASPAGFRSPIAQTQKKSWLEGNSLFLAEERKISKNLFSQTLQ